MPIGFLGAGKMGEALLAALLRGGLVSASEITICDSLAARRSALRRRYRVAVTPDPRALAVACDVIFLAVKPQDLEVALAGLAMSLGRRHLLISIAAGARLERLQRLAGATVRVVRTMPNLPAMVGEAMSAFCLGARATARDRRLTRRLLGAVGQVIELPEEQFDAVTALSGSGPAFCACFLVALGAAGVAEGLSAADARRLALQTLLGTARYLSQTGSDPVDFIQAVASPKGTTAAGLSVLRRPPFGAIVAGAVRAAARRSRELARA